MAELSVDTQRHPVRDFFSTPIVTIVASVLSTFTIAAIFFKLTGPVPISVNSTTVEKQTTFDVAGEGSVSFVPDQAKIDLGITASDSSLAIAQDRTNSTINAIIQNLKSTGVGESDIKTVSYHVSPQFNYEAPPGSINGYLISATLRVTLSDFDLLDQIIDQNLKLGANRIDSITFSLSRETETKALDQAREQAIQEARRKAKTIASQAGIKLGRLLNVEEVAPQSALYPITLRSSTTQFSDESTNLEPGSQETKLSVVLSYETL